jgi:pSer/pThr/pTyr-binding forkhead associated (FHA) protein
VRDSNASVVIGRAIENEFMISEISVSRVHASILLQDNNFYLVDEQGKFGTLVRVCSVSRTVPQYHLPSWSDCACVKHKEAVEFAASLLLFKELP